MWPCAEKCVKSAGRSLRSECVLGVHDAVAIALLGEEPLPVRGEVGVDGVTSDDGVQPRGHSLRLGSQQPSQPLGLLLPRAKGPRDLDCDLSGGQIDREIRHLAYDKQFDLTGTEGLIELLAPPYGRLAGDQWRIQPGSKLFELINILSDDQRRRAPMLG